MTRYQPPRIEVEYGGISNYLDATAKEHNGLDSSVIKRYWNWGNHPHVSIASLARQAGVVWQTMDGWINKLHEEAGIERPRLRDLQ